MSRDRSDEAEWDNGRSVEQAAFLLREAIADGTLAPGSRIKTSAAAQRFGVGTMPIREALRTLEGEGLVTIIPNKGATVRELDRQFVEDVYEVRLALEIAAVARCMTVMTYDKVALLRGALRGLDAALAAEDLRGVIHSSRAIHASLFAMAGNKEAERLFYHGWQIIHTLRLRHGFSATRRQYMIAEYDELIDAIQHRDMPKAQMILRMLYRAGMEDLLSLIEIQPSTAQG